MRGRGLAIGMIGILASANDARSQFVVEETTIDAVHVAMRAGELTARQLVEASLARIEAYDDKGPVINAVIFVNPNALGRADALDASFERSGRTSLSGSLHGIPVLLKDNIETHDMPTTAGSTALAGWRPNKDAYLTQRLREAGAIILAKVNLTEFAATGITRSSLGGQTLNPYDTTRTPGGSSGGTGAGLAANFGLLGIGTDTVNSIRSPASANNVVGIRPTRGLVSRTGVIPYALSQDMAGPLARKVKDAATMLSVIAGYDPADPTTASSVGHTSLYEEAVDPEGLRGARLGVLRSFFGTGDEHEAVNRVMERALDQMRELGAVTIDIDEALDADALIRDVGVSLFELNAHLSSYLARRGAPPRSLEEILDSGKFEPVLEGVYRRALERSIDSPEYKQRLVNKGALQERVLVWMAEHRLDAIVYPLQKRLVVPLGEDQVERNGILASITGFPAITVPGGFSAESPTAPLGVPVGIEFLGRPFTETTLLRLASGFEHHTRHRKLPRSTPPL